MKFSLLALVVLIASASIPQVVSANTALTTEEIEKVASTDTSKAFVNKRLSTADSKSVYDFSVLLKPQINVEIQQKLSNVTGGLSGGSSGPAMGFSRAE